MADATEGSILTSTKKLLGFPQEYDSFDTDIIMFINSAFSTLRSLGVGPNEAFSIADEAAVWRDFSGENKDLNSVPEYVYRKVRLAFDPPANSFTLDAFKESIKELEFRLAVASEKEI